VQYLRKVPFTTWQAVLYRIYKLEQKARVCISNTIRTNIIQAEMAYETSWCNISNPTMRTGLDFKSAQFDQVWGEAEDWIKMRGLEI
jgi:hypothetical protein